MNKTNLLKVLIPICIILGIIGIWYVKNSKMNPGFSPNSLLQNSSQNLTTDDFSLRTSTIDLEKLTSYHLPIIVDFGSDSCAPCRAMFPALETLNAEMQNQAIIKFLDVWKYDTAAADFPIQVIPTQLFIQSDGTPYVPNEKVASEIDFILYNDQESNMHTLTLHKGGLTEEQLRLILTDMGVTQ